MKKTEYEKTRSMLRQYRLLKKELECRTSYIADFKKILINPIPQSEEVLHKIYNCIINEMEQKAFKVQKKLHTIEKILDKLEGPERNVIYYRYIMGIDWITMPEYMNYEQRSCQLFETKALDKILKMNIDWSDNDVE